MKKVFVKISWIPFEAGGRKHPPKGASYVAVCSFNGQSLKDLQSNAWSLRLEFLDSEENQPDSFSYAFASFLSDEAPHELLLPGTEFVLCEGAHAVAQVQVLLSKRLIEQLVAHAA